MPSPNWLSNLKWRVRVSKNIREIDSRNVAPKKHPLDAPLAISLTSFPARFDTLALTLRCLLAQTIRPDAVILWVAENDFPELPQDVLELQLSGLDIQTCEDIKSYKKLIPCLLENPDRYIVTADDDVHYEADWLEKLVSSSMRNTGKIISCRSHRIEYDTDGKLLPYAEWKKTSVSPLRRVRSLQRVSAAFFTRHTAWTQGSLISKPLCDFAQVRMTSGSIGWRA